ncbi:MAG: hypothetical protein A3J74_11135 [Elusimicrobia bacterium RIFCSPHIGHO2_02_FULL_57_9]|nr:MAG: hypothetical protein A3J74_11135 [Elusimicrobia bacterium RIFCSPHIGHO2_02_FULL_57_9]
MINIAVYLILLLACLINRSSSATAVKPQGLSFTGVSNRLITPNGDGKNDTAAFALDNPQFSEVTGKIYDLKGGLVASMTHDSGPPEALIWDGKSGSTAVPGGVYIYVIEGEGKIHRGTVAVVK